MTYKKPVTVCMSLLDGDTTCNDDPVLQLPEEPELPPVVHNISLTNGTITSLIDVTEGAATAIASFILTVNGASQFVTVTSDTDDTPTTPADINGTDWSTDKPDGSLGVLYEVMVSSVLSGFGDPGVVSGDVVDTWVSLSTERVWSISVTGGNFSQRNRELTIQIRDALTQTVQDTSVVSLETFLDLA